MRWLPLLALLLPTMAFAGAKASSHKKDAQRGATFWAANAALDGKLDTAWQVPSESDNAGEWIEITIPEGEIDKIRVYPGFGETAETFRKWPRLAKARVDVKARTDDGEKVLGTASVSFADKAEFQVVDIPNVKATGGTQYSVRLTVEAIHADGTDFPNLAVSDISVVMAEFDAKVTPKSATGEVAGRGKELAFDENAKTSFAAPVGSELTCAMGTFSVSSVGILGGGRDNARAKTVEVVANDLADVVARQVLADKPGEVQWIALPVSNGYNGGYSGDFTVRIVDAYPGTKSQDVAISEVKARATSAEAF